MDSSIITSETDIKQIKAEMDILLKELFPLCRSITGNAVRKTNEIISKHVPVNVFEVKSGTEVFDWIIPEEWNIKDAYIKNSNNEKIIDFQKSNLHVMSYSIPIKTKMRLKELQEHLHSIPNLPDLIPYLTTYYKKDWGFCLPYKQHKELKEDIYEVVIDSELKPGSLTYSEYFIQGDTDEEVIISCYTCHPSMCNDNLSGIILCTFLAKLMSQIKLNFSYRFLFIPETIGAITWLASNEEKVAKIKHGLVVTCVGDNGNFTYKRSIFRDAEIDRVSIYALKNNNVEFSDIDFFPPGSDERQFSSPAFKIPVGLLMRSTFDKFPEYHTSGDNMNLVKPEYLLQSLMIYAKIIEILDNNKKYLNLNPKCEPHLGKRELYSNIGGKKESYLDEFAILALLNLSDGKNTILDIAERTKIDFDLLKKNADLLVENNLLKEV